MTARRYDAPITPIGPAAPRRQEDRRQPAPSPRQGPPMMSIKALAAMARHAVAEVPIAPDDSALTTQPRLVSIEKVQRDPMAAYRRIANEAARTYDKQTGQDWTEQGLVDAVVAALVPAVQAGLDEADERDEQADFIAEQRAKDPVYAAAYDVLETANPASAYRRNVTPGGDR